MEKDLKIKKLFFPLLLLCWGMNYLAMSLFGALRIFEYGIWVEVGARLCWIGLWLTLVVYSFQKMKAPTILGKIREFYQQVPRKWFFLLLLLNGVWFCIVGLHHGIYVESFSSAFTIFIMVAIVIWGGVLRAFSLKMILDSILLGTAPFLYFALFLKWAKIHTLLGFNEGVHYHELPWGQENISYTPGLYAWGLFENANGYGALLMALLVACIAAFLFYWKRGKKTHSILLLIHTVVTTYLLYYTFHRSALLPVVAVVSLFILFNLPRKVVAIFLVVLGIGTMVAFQTFPYLNQKWQQSYGAILKVWEEGPNRENMSSLTSYRSDLWIEAIDVIKENPLWGTGSKTIGLGEIQDEMSNDLSEYKPPIFRTSHHSYLHLVEIFGYPALFLFVICHLFAFYRVRITFLVQLYWFLLFTILFYGMLNGGLFYSLQFYSVFYLFVLGLMPFVSEEEKMQAIEETGE